MKVFFFFLGWGPLLYVLSFGISIELGYRLQIYTNDITGEVNGFVELEFNTSIDEGHDGIGQFKQKHFNVTLNTANAL